MKNTMLRILPLLPLLVLLGAAGCGEKIAIPEARGLFSVAAYVDAGSFDVVAPRGLKVLQGGVFLLQFDTLSKLDQGLNPLENVPAVSGFSDATSLCGDTDLGVVFVFDRAGAGLSWYNLADLAPLGSAALPEVQSGAAMVTNDRGIELAPGGDTFLYISDPDSAVVHRYAFDLAGGPVPFGILARADGESARFVHVPAGLANDPEGNLVVSDADTLRNWVIRFDPTPDESDVTPDPDDVDPMRGLVTEFRQIVCDPLPAAAYVLGDAPECDESDWEGGPSEELGELHKPQGVAVDGSGRVFVADSMNNRIQAFSEGLYEISFIINAEASSVPGDIALVDKIISPSETYYAAYVFVVLPQEDLVRKFMSYEEQLRINPDAPPPPE